MRAVAEWESQVNVVCDFDGTVTTEDVTDLLLEKFAPVAWRDIEARWLAGDIGSRECLASQVALMRATRDDLNRAIDGIKIDPGFSDFIAACKHHKGLSFQLVSDGMDYVISRILNRLGHADLTLKANSLRFVSPLGFALEFPNGVRACEVKAGTCKCAVAQPEGGKMAGYRPTILIGDGASDFCVAKVADVVFAKSRLITYCEANRIPHIPFDGFADITRALPRILQTLDWSADQRNALVANSEPFLMRRSS